jgi:A/G-specific adenine glycosylase
MLGGMRALPDDGWSAQGNGSFCPPVEAQWDDMGSVRHAFTHAHLTLSVRRAHIDQSPPGEGRWWPVNRIGEAGLPTLFAKAAQRALAHV